MNKLRVKPCPICGFVPVLEKESMDYGNGHGYPGCYNYTLSCEVCRMPRTISSDTVCHGDHEKARQQAIRQWNEQADDLTKNIEKWGVWIRVDSLASKYKDF